ncbi:surface-associated interspersed protein 8.3 (SURFIN 8.3) [Plasmodium falciparum NF54]|uniref:Surface-associated interspersed protein 8.3 (SURFIN 8.3) n=2 Tax=Plasmodium falciparum TaxID=5833 RepID=A0A143ZWG8_PLAF7|nr:surface-associated interspersed protein 8.3 (SURFIN 8.3) [Plasmodium falciparum 3D7]KAF4330312.1 surface-associated interspersed protein 8.3 (SURFIN 8.3) [Plasmodium falciparum NF54]PKC47389.1 surface-associated interspersed protein 8.3 (SURFIN 8.3) [Plasmodium falciparum NF54]CZT62741.1 surface-associated interspersed protein 8.3 (SURFIN 8.3) [Plasmodium falciparum 3D7]|eukprot:XP_024329056.1 surface-associated interspersed protein 8.3 (SURFIN 8.3) [Plasmodium falciparum 3D7]
MAVEMNTPVSKKGVSSTAYSIYFSVFLKRLKSYVSDRISRIKNATDYEKPCRDLNYEIDEVKDLFCTRYLLNIPRYVRLASWNKNIEDHLKATMVSDSNQKCKRSYPFYPRIQRYRRKLLADYCEERDKRRDVLNSSNDKDKCLEFNEWVIMSDNAINDSFNNKITEGDRNKGAYTISNRCSLRKPHLLFPLLECHEEKKKEEEPEKKSDSDDEDLNKPKIPEQDHKNVIPGIIGFSNSPSYVGFNPVHAESGMFRHSSPGLTFDKLNIFFDSPIFGHSKITGTAEGFGNIFNMHIEPKDVAIPFDTSPPVSIPASNVTVGSNTPVKITPYLMFTPAVLIIVFISIILNLMNKKKPMIPVKIKEKIKVKSAVPSAEHIRIEELEKLREEMREKELEKLRKKIHVPKKVEIIEEPYKIKLLERKKWLWKTIIEIHMLILEEQRKAEWEFNKADFLHICIDEFSNQEKKSDINVIRSDLLFDEPEVIENIHMMNKQSDIWYRWVERNAHMLEKWKEEKWFLRLKESWRDEEEEYMKRAYKELLISLRGDKYYMSQRQKIIWRKWIAKHTIRVREFVIDKWFNQLFEELEKEGIISDEAIRNFLSQHKEAYDEEKIEAFIKYKKKLLVVILWIKIYMSVLEEYVKEEDIESEKLFIDTSLEELKKKKEIEEEVIEDLKKDIYEIDEKKEIEKYKGEDWFKQMQQDWIRRDYKFVSSYNLESDDEKEFHEFVKKPTMEIQKDLLKEQWKNIELKWIEEDNYDAYLLEDKLLKKTEYIKPRDKMKHRIIKEDDIYSEQLKVFDEIEKRSIYLSSKRVLKWKTIIEIHLEVLHDCKKEEWDNNKGDFLNICIEELVKGQNEDKKNKENYNYITNESDNYDIVEYTKSFCNTWTDRHNYMLEKWNKENWFVQLKNDWKKEQNEYMRKTYKELLISLKGDKYNMSQRQKIIWKKWIAKHPNKMNEEIINIWSNQLSDEIDKNGIISDEAIKNFLSLEKDISDKDLLKCRKKKLEVILWVKIYMSVLEEQKNEELEKSKESFLNTCIDELKKEEYSEENERMITIVDEMKKGFRICDKVEDYKKKKKWKNEEWYKDLKKEWIKEEDKYKDAMDIMEKDEIYEDDLLNKSIVELEKSVSLKHWKDMYIKWIDEDNERDWLRIAIDKKNLKTDEINEDINRMIELNMLEDYSNDLYDKKKIKWKTIIEIHMEVLNDCKNDEWEMNKGDFLDICLEEFGTMENREYSHIINNMLMVGELEYKHLNMDVIERQNDLWNKWIEGHRYMLEKWKKEKWFIVLKENWKNEEHKYMRKAYLELLMSLREDVKNPMLQRQKIIWRKWIAKNLYHIESNVMKKWFDKLLEEILRKGAIEEDECINLIEMEENEEYLEELKEYRKKKLICIIWIKIYMMIIEEHKKEEYLESKEIFLDTCVDELKEQEILEGNELYMDDMKKSILLSDQKEEIEKLKMKNWYKDLKKEWMSEEDRYFRSIINEENDEEYKNMISRPLRDIEKKISKKHWDDIQLKWIDEDNERDWLKIARNENDEDNYAYEYVRNRRKKYMDVYSGYYKRNRRKSGDKISGNEISGNEISGNEISGNKISGKINKINTEKEILNYDIIKEDNNNNDYMNNYMYYNDMENTYEQGSDYRRKDEYFDICFDLLKKGNMYYTNLWIENKKMDDSYEYLDKVLNKMLEKHKFLLYNVKERNKELIDEWEREEWFINLWNDWNEERNNHMKSIMPYKYNITNFVEEEKKIWKEWISKIINSVEEWEHEYWFNDLLERYEMYAIDFSDEIYSIELENYLKDKILKIALLMDIFMAILDTSFYEESEENNEYFTKSEMEHMEYDKIYDLNDEEEKIKIRKWFEKCITETQNGEIAKKNKMRKGSFQKELEEKGIMSENLEGETSVYNKQMIKQKMNILKESYSRNEGNKSTL